MLRSLKNSLKSGKKGSSSSPKEEPQAVVSSSKQHSSSSSKQQSQPAKQQGQPVKEKPPLPAISEQNLQLYYADPLPSFRECTMGLLDPHSWVSACMPGLLGSTDLWALGRAPATFAPICQHFGMLSVLGQQLVPARRLL
jgi:hypothetical protein